jgi:ABC-2 type transport system ATP-binding protein
VAAAIETANLTKDFLVGFWRPRPYRALDDLTLSVEPGETFGFLGPNGAGKSTTLKLLMQLIYPTAGEARILGKPVGDLAVRQRIGFLAENPYFYDYLTAEEVLIYFSRLFGLRGADVKTRVARVLDEVGIGAERRLRLRLFSKGMLQRVGLAQALINDPEVVFLDEPMSGLDPLGRRHVRDLILQLRAKGSTVFFSSHILSDAETLCSRVGIMAQGRLVATGRISEMSAFTLKGWEITVSGVSDELCAELSPHVRLIRPLLHGRYTIQLAADEKPAQLMAHVTARGATVESLNPLRDSLEDYFLQQVGAAASRDTAGL